MSHKATNWLASLPAETLGNSEFRVLFHLCDCHNPSAGCFPTQAYLIEVCNVSNGTLNNALSAMEQKGLIRRHRERDGRTRRQKPTRYILGFEFEETQGPAPKTGDGNGSAPSPKTGDGAVSNFGAKPSPISGVTRLQRAGEVTCKEPVINPVGAPRRSENPLVERDAGRAVAAWRAGRADAFDDLPRWVMDHIIAADLLTPEERQGAGLAERRIG